MTSEKSGVDQGHLRVERYVSLALVVWTGVVGGSLAYTALECRRDTLELARLQARVAHSKDVLYRRWNTTRGPIYAAQSAETAPNPFLGEVAERDIATPSGLKLTRINPAYMTRQVHELEQTESGVRGHITSLKPIRPENAADPWETVALQSFERGDLEASTMQDINDVEYMRLMRPLAIEEGCLACHADQGYAVGEVSGGISVSIPTGPLWAVTRRHIATLFFAHGLVWAVGIAGISIAGSRLGRSRDIIRAKNTLLAEHNNRLAEAYERLDREFRSVGQVQKSLLPASTPVVDGFEFATHYRPAKRAGGDYFDFFALPDGALGVLVADVSGHGAPAAVVMAMTRVMLHLCQVKRPPADVLCYLNNALLADVPSGQFVTSCYGVLDFSDGVFTFASAGHPEPLFYDRGKGTVSACTVEPCYPLGITDEIDCKTSVVNLKPGDTLVIYTDGITEAFDSAGCEFGLERLVAAIVDHASDGAQTICDAVLAAVDEHRVEVDLADDTTLVVVSRDAA